MDKVPILIAYVFLLLLDCIAISDIRRLLQEFMLIKHNRKFASKIYNEQTIKNRISLKYILDYTKEHRNSFIIWQRIYMIDLWTLIPQYVVAVTYNMIWGQAGIYVLAAFAGLKLLLCVVLRFQFDANYVSWYRKK